jgi:hypothetical protein
MIGEINDHEMQQKHPATPYRSNKMDTQLFDWPYALQLFIRWTVDPDGLNDERIAALSDPYLRRQIIALIDERSLLKMISDRMKSKDYVPTFSDEVLQKLVGFLIAGIDSEISQDNEWRAIHRRTDDPPANACFGVRGVSRQDLRGLLQNNPGILMYPKVWEGINELYALCFLHNRKVLPYMTHSQLGEMYGMHRSGSCCNAGEAYEMLVRNLCLVIARTNTAPTPA